MTTFPGKIIECSLCGKKFDQSIRYELSGDRERKYCSFDCEMNARNYSVDHILEYMWVLDTFIRNINPNL